MSLPDRTKQPDLILTESLAIPKVRKERLSNGIPLYLMKADGQKLIRAEFIFRAGKWFESGLLIASSTNALLNEGTGSYNSQQLAERLDYYGSFVQLFSEHDRAGLVLFCLSKYFRDSMKIIGEILKSSIFPQNELDLHLHNSKQQFLINSSRVSFMARQEFSKCIFGSGHPYGATVAEKDFDAVLRKDLLNHYEGHYVKEELAISVSGNWNEDIASILEEHLGQDDWKRNRSENKNIAPKPGKPASGVSVIGKKDALQSAIRIGKRTINRRHPDFTGFSILSIILGGYFGSRLMKNIREDKGYTYGIGAQLVSLEQSGFFVISSEIGSEVCKKAMDEILKEIQTLRESPVGDEELRLVKNYILGNWLRMFDGPLATAETYRVLIDYGFEEGYFHDACTQLLAITPETLQYLAGKYLGEEDLVQVVAGVY